MSDDVLDFSPSVRPARLRVLASKAPNLKAPVWRVTSDLKRMEMSAEVD